MQLRTLNVGCFGGGTGLPSLLGGLKANPWLTVHAVVTMFDSGGSSGQLRDELGVLPPGDVLRCALALARNEREARNVLLARLLDARARAPSRPHRWQPAAVDDGALQRRFSRGGGRPARAARMRRSRVARDDGAARASVRNMATAPRPQVKSRSMPGRPPGTRSRGCGSSPKCGCMTQRPMRSTNLTPS